jgi:SAM-dependent methyltransferase
MARNDTCDAIAADEERSGLGRIPARFGPRWLRAYVFGKLRYDPAYATVAEYLSLRTHALLDIGCGLGLLGQYLRACGHHNDYLGVDVDAKKIAAAQCAARELWPALAFAAVEAGRLPAFRGDVVMLDILHYMPRDAQRALLREAASCVADDGLLILRNVLREANWRFHMTRIEEVWLGLSGWMRTPVGHYPDADDITGPLRASGFALSITPLWGRTPFNSHLIVAARDPALLHAAARIEP